MKLAGRLASFVLPLSLVQTPLAAQPRPAPEASSTDLALMQGIMSDAGYQAALAAMEQEHDRWVDNIIALTQVPAPPFKESARAALYAQKFRELGLSDVEIDEEGNVLGLRRGTGAPGGKLVIVSAHLDSVFPEGTDTTVRREGERLYAPGVGDDATGLATQLSIINAMNEAHIQTPSDILFVGTVGEEGLGDLRGMRYLFTNGRYKDRASAFFSIDGTSSTDFTSGGVGSKRYKLTFRGPGGHSFGAFGLVNPMSAMAQAVVGLYDIPVPASPKTTYSASVVSGGTSINAIPREIVLQVDMRSESAGELAKMEQAFLAAVDAAVAAENQARSTAEGAVSVERELVGDRPAGTTPDTAAIVGYASAAYRVRGISPRISSGSTDSNVPMSLGIPALTIPRAADGGRGHSVDEWIDIERAPSIRIKALDLAVILATAGMR